MKSLIIRIHDSYVQDEYVLNKIIGLLDAKNIYNLICAADLEANPRLAKTGRVTDAIIETLNTAPELFHFKSKGILVSSHSCRELERKRYKLNFNDPSLEGILDGGHNTLAIAHYLLQTAYPEETFKAKTWDEMKKVWDDYSDGVEDLVNDAEKCPEFLVPIEVLYPSRGQEDEFVRHILEISASRNNNAELNEVAKANHAGFYKALASKLDPEINKKVEWKTNEPGKTIKAQDVIALSLIPMLALQERGLLPENITKINPVSVYSSKGICVKVFNEIIGHEDVSETNGGELIKLKSKLIASALDMMKVIPKAYDYIYMNFPRSYNSHSSGFGRISCVTQPKRKTKTKYYGEQVINKYPDGFIVPIVVGLSKLMEVSGDELRWKVDDPLAFLERNLDDIVALLVHLIKSSEFNPQTIGKSAGAYQGISQSFEIALLKEQANAA